MCSDGGEEPGERQGSVEGVSEVLVLEVLGGIRDCVGGDQ